MNVLDAMHGWATDCEWLDADTLDELTPAQLVRGIDRHYDGGVNGFVADAQVAS
jgi:hypothetical protein